MTQLVSYIRDFLHDPDGDRWSNDRILYLINQANLDIAKKTNCLRGITAIPLSSGTPIYDLPKDVVSITRVSLNGCKLDLVTHDFLDAKRCTSCWHSSKGTPRKVVFDKLDRHKIRFYPIPDDRSSYNGEAINQYGIVGTPAEGDGGDTPPYGIMSIAREDAQVSIFSNGALSVVTMVENIAEVHYIRKPVPIISFEDETEIDNTFHDAIKYYVCGNLLRSDADSESRSLGKEELSLYNQEIRQLKRESSLHYTLGSDFQVEYRGFR